MVAQEFSVSGRVAFSIEKRIISCQGHDRIFVVRSISWNCIGLPGLNILKVEIAFAGGLSLETKGEAGAFTLGGMEMLETIIIILLVLWLLGVVSSYTLGGALHMLLVAALVILVVRLATGRRIA